MEKKSVTKYQQYRVAAAHISPVFLDTDKTVDKACSIIAEAARNGAKIVAFPETYISFFPIWSALRSPVYNHDFFRRAAAAAIRVNGPEINRIRSAAKKAEILVSLGINEGTDASVGCIWNSNVLINSDGRILNHHRKIMPTFWEKLVWACGDGAGLKVSETEIGRVGMLICGENTNPLARFALVAQGEQLHVANFPPVWPTHDVPKATGSYNLAAITRIRCGAHAIEGKLYNIVVSGYMDSSMRNTLSNGDINVERILDESHRGVSMVIGPTGEPISEVFQEEEGILYADVDLANCVEPKQMHDLSGGYNRFDIFKLTVNRERNRPIRFNDCDDDRRDLEAADELESIFDA